MPLDSGSKVNKGEGDESKVFPTEIKKMEVLMNNLPCATGLRIKSDVFSKEIKKTEVLREKFRRAIGLRIKGK